MATETKLRQLAEQGCAVYYFYSSERYLVRRAVAAASQLLVAGEDEETTVLDGATPGIEQLIICLLYTSPSPRDRTSSRMPSSA